MKTSLVNTIPTLGRRSRLPLVVAMSLGIAAIGWLSPAQAESVDSEIVLLVDIVRPELSNAGFRSLLTGYANAFTSSEILDSIQAGYHGRIAISMMLYGGSTTQIVGIPWMTIGSAADAQTFAALVLDVRRPNTFAFSNPATALTAATRSFGTETGYAGNGYESAVQIIEVASGGIPSASMAADTATSSANALSSGVDLINSIALGTFAASIDTFYAANVIGSTIPGIAASSSSSGIDGGLAAALTSTLSETVQTASAVSVTTVPEPGSILGLIPATLLLLVRRRA